jgi:predicted nuclease of predicted toxin-antitoxin system
LRFLIDECLHKGLVKVAHNAGYEAYNVVDLGKAGAKDYQLREIIVREEFVFVTNNAKDFKRLFEKTELHPGLVIIVPNVRPAVQDELLRSALEEIAKLPFLVNRVIEVWSNDDVRIYGMPETK